ncbi:MAG: hypothetical protein IKT95_03915, partial [Spirochaetales bacterium]|nr:hypothetical protein [Spirochaetales bacterium]
KKDGTDAPAVYAVGGEPNYGTPDGIGSGAGGTNTAIVLENDVTLEQSPNGTEDSWYSSSGSPYDRNRYMRTTGTTPPTT